jgi:hypothetical protein
MSYVSRFFSATACLAAMATAGGVASPAAAADWHRTYLEPAVGAWMGVVTFLADDGEREERGSRKKDGDRDACKEDCQGECQACRGKHRGEQGDKTARRQHGQHDGRMHSPGRMGPPRPEGPRADALTMLNDIVGRLSRIERMLASRGPASPADVARDAGRSEWRGGRSMMQVSPEMRELMQAKIKDAREKWENASEEERAEMKKMWESRMQEGRERMQKAREPMEKGSAEGEKRPGKPEEMKRTMERAREEGRKRMDEAKAKIDEARKRAQEMEKRVKELEAEIGQMKRNAKKDVEKDD